MMALTERLPQLTRPFITDGGLETTLIYHHNQELPDFAAFDLLFRDGGRDILKAYYLTYARLAQTYGVGLILDSPTWRASPDWGRRLGYDTVALIEANRAAIALMQEVRDEMQTGISPMLVSGNIGPRGDGYNPSNRMTPEEADAYHALQVQTFAEAGADMVTALTMTHAGEAAGIAYAAAMRGLPSAISFTVETDGRLPDGTTLGDAIMSVDAQTVGAPAYYMINCAHPTHFLETLQGNAPWLTRLRGVRANASCKSHAELDAMTELDDGDPQELGREHGRLKELLPQLSVFGGCCGTDQRHIEAICRTLFPVTA